jgi:hypothetical protein
MHVCPDCCLCRQEHCVEKKDLYEAAEKEILHEIHEYISKDNINILIESNSFTQVALLYMQLQSLKHTLQPCLKISTEGIQQLVLDHMDQARKEAKENIECREGEESYLQFDHIRYWIRMYPVSIKPNCIQLSLQARVLQLVN